MTTITLNMNAVHAYQSLIPTQVHSQRIERLWRDVNSRVTIYFYWLFHTMEHEGLLYPSNQEHLFSIHTIFLLFRGLLDGPTTN